jgi:transposase
MPRRISNYRNLLKKTYEEVSDFLSSPHRLVFFFDESRFGLHSSLGRCWARRGIRASSPVNPSYQNFYFYSAVSPLSGDAFSLFLPWVNTEMMNLYLAELAAAFPNQEIMLIWDQAGWHKSSSLKVPENIVLKSLPPYSPELNPVEKLWQWLKKHVSRNRLFAYLDDLMNTLEEMLITLSPTRFRELCQCSYLLQ